MFFVSFFVNRPVFASVLSLLLVVLGTMALFTLPVARYPGIAPPTIVVRAVYPGANAETLAETVAAPLEQAVNGVENMLYMTSQSTNDGVMQLTVTFALGTDISEAHTLVLNRTAEVQSRLPEAVRHAGISVQKGSADLTLVVNLLSPSHRYDEIYLSNYALIHVRDVLARLPGVGSAAIFGARDYSMRIWLDPQQLTTRNLTGADVVNAIRNQNAEIPAGVIGKPPMSGATNFQLTIKAKGRLSDVAAFKRIVVKVGTDGQIVRLQDVARVELGAESYASNIYLDGEPTVGILVSQRPGSNALETRAAVNEAMQRLAREFPQGLEYRIVYDTTIFITESLNAVVHVLLEAMVIVLLVVVVFLQSWRAALIPMLAVPVSLIGTFAVMAALGFSVNTLSLMAMVLAIGIVVDDAIVVVENVERNLVLGLSRVEAVKRAMREVAGPVIATSLVLSAVFVPAAYIGGITGQFYKQFALTIAASTAISAFNSLTLSPALSGLLLKAKSEPPDRLQRIIDRLFGRAFFYFNRSFDWLRSGYMQQLGRVLRLGGFVFVIYGLLLGLTFLTLKQVPTGFIPSEDQGYLIVFAQLPDGTSVQRTDSTIRQINSIILATPGVGHTVALSGWSAVTRGNQSNVGTIFVPLQSFQTRHAEGLGVPTMVASLRHRLGKIHDAFIAVLSPPTIRGLGNVGGFKFLIQDRNDRGTQELARVTQQVIAAGKKDAAVSRLFSTFRSQVPQLALDIDREQAYALGVPLKQTVETLQTHLGSMYVNDFFYSGRTYRVFVQADEKFRNNPEDIYLLKTRNQKGAMVPIGVFSQLTRTTGPDKIIRHNLYTAADINGRAAPGVSSDEVVTHMQQLLDTTLPSGYGYEWTELALLQIQEGGSMKLILPLSILLVFLVLAAQYESWTLPLSVILIAPLCLLAAAFGLWLAKLQLNIFAQIGFLVLVGLASKNAILIVEFAKRDQEVAKANCLDAAMQAARLRLRPILMTSLAFILGALPLISASGAGAESRQLLGIAVVSGMIGVTIFGLLLTPAFYVAVRRLVERKRGS